MGIENCRPLFKRIVAVILLIASGFLLGIWVMTVILKFQYSIEMRSGEVRERIIAGPLTLHDRQIPMPFCRYLLPAPIGSDPDWHVMCEFSMIGEREGNTLQPGLCAAVAEINALMERMEPHEAVKIKEGFMLALGQQGEEGAIAYAQAQWKLRPQ